MTTTPTEPPDPSAPELAGLGARLAAKLIDLTIAAAIAFTALFLLGIATLDVFEAKRYSAAEAYPLAAPFLGVPLFEAAVIATTAFTGATPGSKLLKIQVISRRDSRPPPALRAIARWAIPLAATAPLVDAFIRDIPELASNDHLPALSGRVWWLWVALGWWLLVHASALWDSRRRGWHDMAADTIVVKAPRTHDPAGGHGLLTGGEGAARHWDDRAPRDQRHAVGTPSAGPTEESGRGLDRAWLARRLAARVIDTAVVALPTLIWLLFVVWVGLSETGQRDVPAGFRGAVVLLATATYVPTMVYEVALTARRGRTLGKDASGIMVVRRDDGQLPSAWEALVRWMVLAASGIVGLTAAIASPMVQPDLTRWDAAWLSAGWLVPLLLVFASSLLHRDRRGWHDKAAGTIVVKAPPRPRL